MLDALSLEAGFRGSEQLPCLVQLGCWHLFIGQGRSGSTLTVTSLGKLGGIVSTPVRLALQAFV